MDLEDVFRQHQPALFAYFLRTTGNRGLAEELTQETFYRACSAAIRFRGESPVINWLFGIGRRVLMEGSRRGAFRFDLSLDDTNVVIERPTEDPDHRLDLEAALAVLAAADREVLVLVDLLGFTPSEAAGLIDIDDGAFRMRLHRARRRIRSHLEVHHE